MTSTIFDEPLLLELLLKHKYVISAHGMTNTMKIITGFDIYLGGLNRDLIGYYNENIT